MNWWFFFAILIIYIVVKRADFVARVGHFRHARGDNIGAVKAFAFADKIGNMHLNNKIAYGYLLLRTGDINAANKVLTIVSMQAPVKKKTIKLRAKSMLALVMWKRGDLDDAIETLEKVFAEYKSVIIYQSLGLMYLHKGEPNRALEFALEAYDYDDGNTIIIDNLAEAYVLNGNLEKAKEMYEKLFEMNPHFPEAYFGYGKLLIELGEREKGLELVKQSLDKPFTFLSSITREQVENYLMSINI